MLYTTLHILFLISAFLMMILILLRKGSESAGLSSAFGGVGGDAAFGVKAQKHLDKVIAYVATFFIFCGVVMNLPNIRPGAPQSIDEDQVKQEQPAVPAVPVKEQPKEDSGKK